MGSERNMKKTTHFGIMVVSFLLLGTLVIPSSVLSVNSDTEKNEIAKYCNTSLSDVVILAVKMADYNIKCEGLSGQIVDMGVEIRYMVDRNLIEPFTISLYLDQSGYIEHQDITKDMIIDGKNRVIFDNIHLSTKIGIHTLDAYINDDDSTHKYCLFRTSLIGLGTRAFPILERILDRIFR